MTDGQKKYLELLKWTNPEHYKVQMQLLTMMRFSDEHMVRIAKLKAEIKNLKRALKESQTKQQN